MKLLKWFKPILLVIVGLIVLLLFVGFSYEQIMRYIAKNKFPPKGILIDGDGQKLHMIKKGTGSPVIVFESGLGGTSFNWRKVQKEISKHTTTIAYDRAGFLWSERSNKPKTCNNIARDLHTMLHNAGYDSSFILIGHSMAGLTLRPFVDKYSDKISGIIMVDAVHPETTLPSDYPFKPMKPEWKYKLASSVGIARKFFSTPLNKELKQQDTIKLIDHWYMPINYAAYIQEYNAYLDGSLNKEVSNAQSFGDIPLIILAALCEEEYSRHYSDNRVKEVMETSLKMQNDQAKLSSDSKIIICDTCGHNIPIENPKMVIDAAIELIYKFRNDTSELTQN